jgi:hypothetical protein
MGAFNAVAPAAAHLDAVLGTSRAAPFIASGGPWQQWRTTEETPADLHAWIEPPVFGRR